MSFIYIAAVNPSNPVAEVTGEVEEKAELNSLEFSFATTNIAEVTF